MPLFIHGRSLRTRRRLMAMRLIRARKRLGHTTARHYYWAGRLGPTLPRVLVYRSLRVSHERRAELLLTPENAA